jgi:hypothetical protein
VRAVIGLWLALACVSGAPDRARYRLAHSGSGWVSSGGDAVLEDLRPRYPEYFDIVLHPERSAALDLRPLREDLERRPVDRRNFDALNAVAIGYFELNLYAEASRGDERYVFRSMRAAELAAMPWKAYGLVDDARLRDSILDFFEDVASGEKLDSARTAPRLASTVASLERKESDPMRIARIRRIRSRLESQFPLPR